MSQAKPCAHGKNLAGVIAAKIDCGGESFKRILALAHYEDGRHRKKPANG